MSDKIAMEQTTSERVGLVERIVTERIYESSDPLPEPCEFTSTELIAIAITGVRQAIDNPSQSVSYLFDVLATLAQAEAQLKYNNGAATPFPEVKDPWAWEDADSYGPSA